MNIENAFFEYPVHLIKAKGSRLEKGMIIVALKSSLLCYIDDHFNHLPYDTQ
jgi:hypothetical protein